MLQGSLSGFVLVGGDSRRMGRNKALLPYDGRSLAQHVAAQLSTVASPVCLVGSPELYGILGLPVVSDVAANCGPLSGIAAALLSGHASEWNLVAACDMPGIHGRLLRDLVEQIDPVADCIVPRSSAGKLQPLCAIYNKTCGPPIRDALAHGTRRVVDMVAMLQAKFWRVDDAVSFQNVNTAPEWDRFLNDR